MFQLWVTLHLLFCKDSQSRTHAHQLCTVVGQAALDQAEAQTKSAQPGSDASNSDSAAASHPLKQKKKKQARPAAELLEDQGLNAELDAANAGGLVETERDRLIRIVSTQCQYMCTSPVFSCAFHAARICSIP